MGLAYYNEHDPYAAQWLRNLIAAGHIAPGVVDERSIEDVVPSDLFGFTQCHFFAGVGVWSYALRLIGWPDDRPVWTASCPCQPFSAAGFGAAFEDPRHLYPSLSWLIRQCKPAVLFGEQVANKTVEPWVDLVQADLEGMDYAFGAVAFPSSGVGATHIRDRVYWVGYADDSGPQGHWQREAEGRGAGHGLRQPDGSAGAPGCAHGLANTDGQPQGSAGNGSRVGEPGRCCEAGGLADLHCDGCDQGRIGEPAAGDDGTERDGTAGGLANTDGQLDNGTWQRRPPGHTEYPNHGAAGRLADPECGNASITAGQRPGPGTASGAGAPGELEGRGSLPDPRPAGPANGFWRTADWLFCRDGKWRAVEPGTFPLADGAASRVGRLRAYGNAVNAQQAAIFIETAMGIPRCVYSDL